MVYPTTNSGRNPIIISGDRESAVKTAIDCICSNVLVSARLQASFCNDPQHTRQLKQNTYLHGLSEMKQDIETNLVNIIKDNTSRNHRYIAVLETIPKMLFPKSLIKDKGYTFKDHCVKIVGNEVNQGFYSTLFVENKEFYYSTQCGNWKLAMKAIGDYSCEDDIIRYLYSKANHARRCALLGHLAFEK
jgi:hypothetical protein